MVVKKRKRKSKKRIVKKDFKIYFPYIVIGVLVISLIVVSGIMITPLLSEGSSSIGLDEQASAIPVETISCLIDSDCDDSNECTNEFCRGETFCMFEIKSNGTICDEGYCVKGFCSDTCGDMNSCIELSTTYCSLGSDNSWLIP